MRIQEWLARTPDLRLRRGGSVMLSQATGRTAWPDHRLPPGTNWNEQAGDLDGVVSLVAAADVPPADVTACLEDAARVVARSLREALPQCYLQAVGGSGESYAEAFEQMEQARREGALAVDVPPAGDELILAKPCDVCRAAAAEPGKTSLSDGETAVELCADCRLRAGAAGGTRARSERRAPRPERRMREALMRAGMTAPDFPDDFADLADRGRTSADDAATQLGLIYADGNRVGAFLAEAAAYARRHGQPAKSEIVRAVDDSILAALADAIIATFPGSENVPVLAHVAGGDDLLVSVPASYAWPFVSALLPAFGDRLAAALDWPDPVRAGIPSLSAGLVFHHVSAPFADVVRLASQQLKRAKVAGDGEPAVAFLDLTADGGEAPERRPVLTAGALRQQATQLALIAAVPRSHRETLVALQRLATEPAADAGTARPGETPAQALGRRVVDLGWQPIWDAVLGRRAAEAPEVRAALESDVAAREELRRVLDLARWWPPADLPDGHGRPRARHVSQEARA